MTTKTTSSKAAVADQATADELERLERWLEARKEAGRVKLRKWFKAGHSIVAVAGVAGAFILLEFVGSTFHADAEAGAGHLLQMILFAVVALILAIAVLYTLLFTPIQKIALPHADVLLDLEEKWRAHRAGEGDPLTAEEVAFSRACATSAGFRILAVMAFIAMLATPL